MTTSTISDEKDLSVTKRPDEKESKLTRTSQFIIQLVGAGIFGAISIVLSAIITANPAIVPRITGWGIAIVDPISIIWMCCFLIFGVEAGILCSFIGFVGLIPFDTWVGIIGPLMKLSATLSLMIVPILALRLYKRNSEIRNSQKLKKPINYIAFGGLGIVLRIFMMLFFNTLIFLTILGDSVSFVSLGFLGLPEINGWTAIILGVIIINITTSLFDLIIPYGIVFGILDYGLKLDDKFEIW